MFATNDQWRGLLIDCHISHASFNGMFSVIYQISRFTFTVDSHNSEKTMLVNVRWTFWTSPGLPRLWTAQIVQISPLEWLVGHYNPPTQKKKNIYLGGVAENGSQSGAVTKTQPKQSLTLSAMAITKAELQNHLPPKKSAIWLCGKT